MSEFERAVGLPIACTGLICRVIDTRVPTATLFIAAALRAKPIIVLLNHRDELLVPRV